MIHRVIQLTENAQKYHVNPERIFAMGFSAGGHLTASLGSFWHREDMTGVWAQMAKPAGTVLVYPVITTGEFTSLGTTSVRHPDPHGRAAAGLVLGKAGQ